MVRGSRQSERSTQKTFACYEQWFCRALCTENVWVNTLYEGGRVQSISIPQCSILNSAVILRYFNTTCLWVFFFFWVQILKTVAINIRMDSCLVLCDDRQYQHLCSRSNSPSLFTKHPLLYCCLSTSPRFDALCKKCTILKRSFLHPVML